MIIFIIVESKMKISLKLIIAKIKLKLYYYNNIFYLIF